MIASSESTIYHVIHKSTFATYGIPQDYAAMLHITDCYFQTLAMLPIKAIISPEFRMCLFSSHPLLSTP